ncbi:flagellar basal body P-ring formation protein FlgA [Psychrosphaera ytuae]|uniref:Flagella basal body P-ring formation protein FlgA n=1 Tax=Psychrosphaera ytuae TaxID=2820710 RepID=A0A975DD05_9GAMM|nr:flagellar basal body P-ring formation chaperone FlgA [Psychrosphaera ytuae]QTH64653.1 flagellar basal body P-ring formation protein FlgA [Psychrosphaera ytuae]
MLKNLLTIILTGVYLFISMPTTSAMGKISLAHQTLLEEVSEHVSAQLNPNQTDNITVTALPLDSRIRIKQCPEDIVVTMSQSRSFSRQFPVKAECLAEGHEWKAYVQVQVQELIETLVTTTNIAKGEVITDDMIKKTLVDKHRVNNKATDDIARIAGGRAMRNIAQGYQISSSDVCLVCKGDSVAIVATMSNMQIKTSGTAMENGSFGESIRVKNNNSERIVKGVIDDLRQILIKL